MALTLHSIGFDGHTIGRAPTRPGVGDDFGILAGDDEGVDGLGLPQFDTTLTRGQRHGAVRGPQWAGAMTLQARVWTPDTERLLLLRQSMKPRPHPDDEVELAFRGLGFPATHSLWVSPEVFEYRVGRLATVGDVWIADVAWTSSDGVIYGPEVTHRFGVNEAGATDPTDAWELRVPNPGLDRTRTGRAFQFRMTARNGPVVRPFLRVRHDNGEVEQITWDLTIAQSRVLTLDHHQDTRVGTVPQLGAVRTLWDGQYSRAPRFPSLTPGDTNLVQVGAYSGEFSGNIQVRGTW